MKYAHFVITAPKKQANSQKGVFSIVNSSKNGKRICISGTVLKKIGVDLENPIPIDIVPVAGGIGIGAFPVFGPEGNAFSIKKQGQKGVIYSAALVKAISEHLSLDFSEDTVCRTLHNVRYRKNKSGRYAVIWEEETDV